MRLSMVCCRKQSGEFGPDLFDELDGPQGSAGLAFSQGRRLFLLAAPGHPTSRPNPLDVETDDLEPLQVVRELGCQAAVLMMMQSANDSCSNVFQHVDCTGR